MGDLINIVKINFLVYILKKHFTNKSREVNSFVLHLASVDIVSHIQGCIPFVVRCFGIALTT